MPDALITVVRVLCMNEIEIEIWMRKPQLLGEQFQDSNVTSILEVWVVFKCLIYALKLSINRLEAQVSRMPQTSVHLSLAGDLIRQELGLLKGIREQLLDDTNAMKLNLP